MVANDQKNEGGVFTEAAYDGVQFNELVHLIILTNHILESGVTPNVDTQYSSVFLDVSDEPVVVEVSVTKDRYYRMMIFTMLQVIAVRDLSTMKMGVWIYIRRLHNPR